MAAINKRKILESAQRHLQKGALDKALADYQTVLQADPRDTNVRLKVGDLLQKAGRNDEAISAYLKVADQFQRDGFDAKAVALYKQVTKIDSKRHDVYVPLADLYQRLGLMSEAMAALQTAAQACQRDGRKREALDLLRRMASLDPANVTSRLKVAELLEQEGLGDEAMAEFREAASELERQGDWEARAGVLERMVELRPERVEELEALANTWLEHGQPRRAHAFAQKLVEADPARPDSHELLARVLSGLGQEELAIDAFRQCAEAWRERGEEGRAREILQRHLPPQDFAALTSATPSPVTATAGGTAAAAELFGAAGELGSEPAAGEGVFGSEPIEVGGDGVVELGGDAPAFAGDLPLAGGGADLGGEPEPAPAPAAPAKPAQAAPSAPSSPAPRAAEPAPEGDVEQLLAEAAVYARYGKHERALACLEAALAQEPAHGAALEQLGDVQAAAGAPERAVEAWTRAAEQAGEARDAARFALLRARIEGLDPAAAAALHAPLPAGAAAPTVLFDLGQTGGVDEAEEAPAGELDDIEIDVDDVSLDGGEHEPAPGSTGAGAAELELDLDDGSLAAVEPAGAPAHAAAVAPEPDLDLDLDDRSEPAPAPDDAAGEVEDEIVFDGEDAAASLPVPDDTEPPAAREQTWELPEEELATAPPHLPRSDAAADVDPAVRSEVPPGELSASAAQHIQEDLEEAGFYFDQGLLAEAEAVYRRILARAPSHPGALLRLGEIAVQRGGPIAVPAPLPVAPEPAAPAVAREDALEVEPPDALDLTAPALDEDEWPGEVAPPVEAEDSTANVLASGPDASLDDTTLRPTPAPAFAVAPAPEAPVAPAAPAPVAVAAAPRASEEPELTAPDLPQDDETGGAAFDLAAELSEALADATPSAGAGTDDEGFSSLFREFKRGVSQTLGEGDVETHFDLGIAYREMGLLEDAIGEFRHALGSPVRRLDALQLMGLCAIDLGRGQDAVGHLEQALASPDVPSEREAPLRYELGRAYQILPDRVRALDAFHRVQQLEPGFQDVAERVAALERGSAAEPEAEPAESVEAFESFDDLVAEAAEDAPAAPRYESFDDVVAEANHEDEEVSAELEEASPSEEGEGTELPDSGAGGSPDDGGAALERETEAAFLDATLAGVEVAEPESGPAPEHAPEPQTVEPVAPVQRRRRKVSFF
ncbi:MAG: tetratricopeptide repeat protein [Deltaproteobacteria bacterium]|nr:tetratricopeptide repeat protein [Deltaproteobacteria bacterium]